MQVMGLQGCGVNCIVEKIRLPSMQVLVCMSTHTYRCMHKHRHRHAGRTRTAGGAHTPSPSRALLEPAPGPGGEASPSPPSWQPIPPPPPARPCQMCRLLLSRYHQYSELRLAVAPVALQRTISPTTVMLQCACAAQPHTFLPPRPELASCCTAREPWSRQPPSGRAHSWLRDAFQPPGEPVDVFTTSEAAIMIAWQTPLCCRSS